MIDITVLDILRDFGIAFVIGFCWAILFGSPRRLLWVAGLMGGLGHCIRFVLIQFDAGLITATLAGSVFIGLAGIWVAHWVDSPPVVFTMPACITMIPGMFAYRTMLAGIKLTDTSSIDKNPQLLLDMSHNLMLTMSLLFALAIGICIGALLFRKSSVKNISFRDIIGRG
ncbi:threonine/serine exporter family protein [Dysgonomonas sp. 511]|uniref:threonine/serine exporter family protein n=1 Tax=Dysgonomonas sp. 511 TaxID=2302930 RepID=UPI0013D7384E|nr:threonine/serine exporter family protein [Dysgonomonas sp. 511]NDV79142.1 threonine/serine exporter [Dysgonomonas sp. 511]